MLDVYDRIPFYDVDGGLWTQGWDVTYNESQWDNQHKLKVFVVPHSHNDPGWLETFDRYYDTDTKYILDSMLAHLKENPKTTLIWAEISYFSRWFEALTDADQQIVKTYVSLCNFLCISL